MAGGSVEAVNFSLHDLAKWRQSKFDGLPYSTRRNVFVVVTINVSSPCHFTPFDIRMAIFEFLRQSARGLGNNLKTSGYRVHAQRRLQKVRFCQISRERLGKVDPMKNVQKQVPRLLRRH